jgi:hypothetical protein
MTTPKKRTRKTQKRPRFTGWSTSDADEIERRRLRGREEAIRIVPLDRADAFYGAFLAHSSGGHAYRVEIRSLTGHINSCDCPDHRVNGLGTCKHIEATLQRLQQRRRRLFQKAAATGSPSIEIFLDRRSNQVRNLWPQASRQRSRTRSILAPFFDNEGNLPGDPLDKLPALERAIAASPASVRRRIRLSNELQPWLEFQDRRAEQIRTRQHFEAAVAAGKESLDAVKMPLYAYQQEGMLHLAFTGRALLADEMGLGKTVQAVAACALLRRLHGIRRVLVVAPASLKAEWEEQIAKFSDLPSLIIQGTRDQRLRQYPKSAFFYLANYEQIRPDVEDINQTLAPDVIILDEAQRIKNWQTKTATAVKRLTSRYAFVLTGTPVENRIDEIYSIAQFLDPHLFGPLFRFNRDFYQLDERGHAIGYKNLDKLHERLRPLMLRRRKAEVEGQLPGRTVKTYFVAMHPEQCLRYDEYKIRVARLTQLAKRRPLKKEEMERLQRNLACMRMLCDTPYILDQTCRISPKLKELGNILQELMADGDHKIIIFSEWERMLQLVREQAEDRELGFAWHTGTVPQPKRRTGIRRFKDDPECRLFLSTDSGAVGLNLQVADVVINLDLPWNPAKLEQRIARAWRKHQKRPVQVINLVCEHSIEHRMLSLLEQKRSLAEGVVDGKGNSEMSLPSGRAAFLERIDSLMADGTTKQPAPPADPLLQLRDQLLKQWRERLQRLELHGEGERQTLLVVTDQLDDPLRDTLTRQINQHLPNLAPRLELIDSAAYQTLQRLIEAGVLSANTASAKTLYCASTPDTPKDDGQAKRLAEAQEHLAKGEHKQRMAKVLAEGGFVAEALIPMREAVETALQALAIRWDWKTAAPIPIDLIDVELVKKGLLPDEILSLTTHLRADQVGMDEKQTAQLLLQGVSLMKHVGVHLEQT